ncbi:MAG TPA: class I SAM-dependent methyltransferase [Methanothrix sp.]|nr:class I SAM-dependent methyltransferase [Methanothrix sp.]
MMDGPRRGARAPSRPAGGLGEGTEGVYPPAEDTHLLLAASLKEVAPEDAVLEIGCGSGIISKALRHRARWVVATDVNPAALRRLRREGVEVLRADLFAGIRGRFDLVLFNPPYLPTEEDEVLAGWINFAFDGGKTGRETIGRFLEGLRDRFVPERGRALLVVSSLSGPDEVEEKARSLGLTVEVVARERWFFEELLVVRLSPTPSAGAGGCPGRGFATGRDLREPI